MLVVNPEERFTIDQCLAHPWMTAGAPSVNDSTDGLVGGLASLEVRRSGLTRQRTLLSSINSVEVTNVPGGQNHGAIKIFNKNGRPGTAEPRPAGNRQAQEFMELGGRGDPVLFDNDSSHYSKADIAATKKAGKPKKK